MSNRRNDQLSKFLKLINTNAVVSGDIEGYINFEEKVTLNDFIKAAKELGLRQRTIFTDDEMGVTEIEFYNNKISIGAVFTRGNESESLVTNYCYFKRKI